MTLRWRLTLFYTALLALLLLVIAVAVVGVLSNSLQGNLKTQLNGDLRQIVDSKYDRSWFFGSSPATLRGSISFEDPSLYVSFDEVPGLTPEQLKRVGTEFLSESILPGQATSYNLQDGTGQRPTEVPFVLDQAALQGLQRNGSVYTYAQLERPGSSKTIPVLVLSKVVPHRYVSSVDNTVVEYSGIFHLARDLSPVYRTVSLLQLIMLLVSLLGVLAAGLGTYALAGRALLPLRLVRKAAESISEKTLRQRVPAPATGDEVEALALALNGMLDRLERSFEVQRRFTSDASHELRTPVTAIGGHAGYLLRRTQPNPQQRESLDIIKNESERLSTLIASLLELARSDSGATQLRRQPVLAQLFLADVCRELRPLAQEHGSQVRVTGDEVELYADPDKLRQVVLNLVSNALKAGAGLVTVSSRREGDSALLRVADNGPGIAAEHLDQLFGRFYRVEESRSRDQGGSGLGLAIVKAIVDAHGGSVWVESELGKGTQVNVKLPIGVPEPGQEAEAEFA